MKNMKISFAFVALIFCGVVQATQHSKERLRGGVAVGDGAYPATVSIRLNNVHICTGAIVKKNYVITTAECLYSYKGSKTILNTISVNAGTNKLSSTGTKYGVASVITHENYNAGTKANNLALIKTKTNMSGQKIKIASIPSIYSDLDVPIIVSWGASTNGGTISNDLQKTNVLLKPWLLCMVFWPGLSIDHICTYSLVGNSVCDKDNGANLYSATGQLIGILSWYKSCGFGYPDVFTKLSYYKSWIDSKTQS